MPNLLPTPRISPKTTACPSLFDIEQSEMHLDSTPQEYVFPEPHHTVISRLSSSPERQVTNKSYDMSLAQLQEILKLGSDVLNCACATSDASIPVALSLLAARIVSILERLCRRAREDDLVARGQAQVNVDGDRYSLGMYQIAKEDERRLKQEMLSLQIKKAELMVLCSRELVGRASGPMDTQAMVSEKLFSFLGEQVGEVKREWDARNGEV
ncbi:hypothetical protein BJ875DRAFT_372986 [Amylocarpus encephaloides]|uniref:Uncharacterized protein n=1 Tax=Amylocarpus encephaloides TaxID=45428 RepID=A0A9P8C6S9_9HELO|nr:hypothetical protein BJ875DRAFT_372986 [Amylocarpus encephaloides]